MRRAFIATALCGTALLPLIAQAAAQIGQPAPKTPAPQQSQVLLLADTLDYDDDHHLVSAVGHVEIVDQGRTLLADRVDYDKDSDTVTAKGHISVTDTNGNVSFSDHLVLSDHMRDGVLQGFGALIGKSGRLAAISAQRLNGTTYIAHFGVYSPCKICQQQGSRTPLWQIKSERIVYDQTKHRVRFHNATIDVQGVPVAWLPFFSVVDPTVHYATGLLTPDVGNSTKIGYFIRAPIYVEISHSQDMTVAPMITTLGGDVVQTEYRLRLNNGGMWLQGSGAYNPKGGLSGSAGAQTYGHLFGAGRFGLGDNWRTGFDIQTTTNPAYMRFYDISFLDRLTNDLFIEDTPGRSRFNLASYYFEGLRSTDIAARIPYVLPRLEASFIPTQKVAGGSLRIDLSGVSLGRDTGHNDQRISTEINWKTPVIWANGQIWTFVLDGRGDEYHFQSPATSKVAAADYWIERGTAYAALDWRWPFIAQGKPGHSYVVEPIAQFIAQPYGGNPKNLRIEDAGDFEFSDTNVFSFNQVPGYDLIESGPRTNVGMRAEAFFPGGSVEAQVGQTYRLKPDPTFAGFLGNTGTASDVVGSLSVKFPHLDITDRVDVDRSNGHVRRHEIYVTGSYSRSSLQVSFIQLPESATSLGLPSRREINAQADINIWRNWQVFVAGQRDLEANQFLNTELGLGYEDECLAISLAYRRKYTEDLIQGVPPSTAVVMRFSLKTGDQAITPFSLFPKDVFSLTHP